jgi:hypothetical protein
MQLNLIRYSESGVRLVYRLNYRDTFTFLV